MKVFWVSLISDAFRDYFEADIAFMSGGGIRDALPKGKVTLKTVYAILPFSNPVHLFELSGEDVIRFLEQGLLGIEKLSGDFLQVSGLQYAFRLGENGKAELTDVQIKGKPIDLEQKYTVVMNEFMRLGGGSFDPIPDEKIKKHIHNGSIDSEVLKAYVTRFDTLKILQYGRILVE